MDVNTKYKVSPEGLQETMALPPNQPFAVRILAQLVSIIFHPLFIPSYVAAFLLYVHPIAFAGFSDQLKIFRFLTIFLWTGFFIGFFVFLMWRLKLVISSIYLNTQKERIIPYAIAMFFYFWVWYVFKSLSDSPFEIRQFLLGAFLGLCGAWMANIFFKISMHTTAVGGLMMYFLLMAFKDGNFGGSTLSIVIFITGLVTTARLAISNHTRQEIYTGLIIGAVAQVVALWFT